MPFALALCTQVGGDQLLPLQKKVMSPGLWQNGKVNHLSVSAEHEVAGTCIGPQHSIPTSLIKKLRSERQGDFLKFCS